MSGPFDPSCVDVLDFLEVLEVENVRREGYHEARFSCPYPGHENGDQSASAYMNLETTAWYCHGCKRKGNAISFCSSMLNISPMKAKRILREAYAPHTLNPDERNMRQELEDFFARAKASRDEHAVNVAFPETVLEPFAVEWDSAYRAYEECDGHPATDYLFGRGFEWTTLDNWDFGYDERTDRITFAVRNEHGELVGVKGRAVGDRHPKYLVLGDARDAEQERYGFTRYYTGSVVFGLHAAIDQFSMLDHGEPAELIVCEGELNAVALWQMGYHTAVALNGSNLTERQARLLRVFADKATFFFDFDKAGLAGMWGWQDEKGEHHPGALEILSQDMDLRLVGSFDKDAAEALEKGFEAEIDMLLANATTYTQARLARRLTNV